VVLEAEVDLTDRVLTGVAPGACLDGADLTRCVLDGVRLTAVSARRARLTDVVLRNCELSGVDLEEARLTRVRFEGCRAEALDGGLVRARDVVVVDTKLTDAAFRMSSWERCRLEDADLRRLDLLDAALEAVRFEDCDLTEADLTRARLTSVSFPRSTLVDLRGAQALAGSTIDASQMVSVAVSLFAAMDITVAD
jgi:uncharacterized protein YjbI with pentapeptide repeats